MKLSDGEKLIILMLSELYEKLGVEGEIEPDFIKSAIFGNQLWGLKWKYSGIPFEESEDPEVVKEVEAIGRKKFNEYYDKALKFVENVEDLKENIEEKLNKFYQ